MKYQDLNSRPLDHQTRAPARVDVSLVHFSSEVFRPIFYHKKVSDRLFFERRLFNALKNGLKLSSFQVHRTNGILKYYFLHIAVKIDENIFSALFIQSLPRQLAGTLVKLVEWFASRLLPLNVMFSENILYMPYFVSYYT